MSLYSVKPNRARAFKIFAVLLVCSAFAPKTEADDEVNRLKAAINERQTYLDRFIKGPGVARGTERQATLTVLSEEAINSAAKKANIKTTDEEIESALKPLLAQQCIIDIATTTPLANDENVKLWLRAQSLKYEDLVRSGRTLVLWTKIATKDVSVTPKEVEAFVNERPQLRLVPTRVQIVIASYIEPGNFPTRGLSLFEGIAPRMSIALARTAEAQYQAPPEDWKDLHLYFNLDDVDPNLRTAIAGLKSGDSFGPVPLRNGAVLGGRIGTLLPSMDLSRNQDFWKSAAVRARLNKANQEQTYQAVVLAYLRGQSPAVRDIFSDAADWVQNNLSTVGSVVGGGIGLLSGGPGGAVAGAQIGNQIGTTLQGWVNGQPPTVQQITSVASAAGINLPPGFSLPPFPPLPPAPNSAMGPFLHGSAPMLPSAYNFQPSATVVWAPGYNQSAWAGFPINSIPQPFTGYANYFEARMYAFPPTPPPPPIWAPPVFMPYTPYMF